MLKYYILAWIPLLGTSIGALTAIFYNKVVEREDTLVVFATGILSAITFNLFVEAYGNIRYSLFWGVVVGFLVMWVANLITRSKNLTSRDKVFWGMVIHNIPEGLVVGTALAGNSIMLATIVAITIQNIPDGMVVAASALVSTRSRTKAILYGILSGLVEPIATFAVILAAKQIKNIQAIEAFLIGFALATILVILVDLFKECKENKGKNMVWVIATVTIAFTYIVGSFG